MCLKCKFAALSVNWRKLEFLPSPCCSLLLGCCAGTPSQKVLHEEFPVNGNQAAPLTKYKGRLASRPRTCLAAGEVRDEHLGPWTIAARSEMDQVAPLTGMLAPTFKSPNVPTPAADPESPVFPEARNRGCEERKLHAAATDQTWSGLRLCDAGCGHTVILAPSPAVWKFCLFDIPPQ